jgi:hypothetical protein
MPVVGRGNEHGVNIFLFQQPPEIFVGTSTRASALLGRSHVGVVPVRDRGKLHVRGLSH